MAITAITLFYWVERRENMKKLVDALRSGSLPPEEIIVWNNSPEEIKVDGATVIWAGKNFNAGSRFAAAFLAKGDTILFQDDDLMVKKKTVENLARFLDASPKSVVAPEGRIIDRTSPGPYQAARYVNGRGKTEVQECDIDLGRMTMMRREIAIKAMRYIPSMCADDDICASWAVQLLKGKCLVVPFDDDSGTENLPEFNKGLSLNFGEHYKRRNDLVRRLWEIK